MCVEAGLFQELHSQLGGAHASSRVVVRRPAGPRRSGGDRQPAQRSSDNNGILAWQRFVPGEHSEPRCRVTALRRGTRLSRGGNVPLTRTPGTTPGDGCAPRMFLLHRDSIRLGCYRGLSQRIDLLDGGIKRKETGAAKSLAPRDGNGKHRQGHEHWVQLANQDAIVACCSRAAAMFCARCISARERRKASVDSAP